MSFVNNKCADQPTLPRSLISTFFAAWTDSKTRISKLLLDSVAAEVGLNLTCLDIPKTHCRMVLNSKSIILRSVLAQW